MSEPKSCTVEKLLAGFAQLSPEDQEKVRTELGTASTADDAGHPRDPAVMMEQMMRKMKEAGYDPMRMCREMMGQR